MKWQEESQDEGNKEDHTKLWYVKTVNININYQNYINKTQQILLYDKLIIYSLIFKIKKRSYYYKWVGDQ